MCQDNQEMLNNLFNNDNNFITCSDLAEYNKCHHSVFDVLEEYDISIQESRDKDGFHYLVREVCPTSCQTTLKHQNTNDRYRDHEGVYDFDIYDCFDNTLPSIGEFHKCILNKPSCLGKSVSIEGQTKDCDILFKENIKILTQGNHQWGVNENDDDILYKTACDSYRGNETRCNYIPNNKFEYGVCTKRFMETREGIIDENYENGYEVLCDIGEDGCFNKNYCDNESLWDNTCDVGCEFHTNYDPYLTGFCQKEGILFPEQNTTQCAGHTTEDTCTGTPAENCIWYNHNECSPYHESDMCAHGQGDCQSINLFSIAMENPVCSQLFNTDNLFINSLEEGGSDPYPPEVWRSMLLTDEGINSGDFFEYLDYESAVNMCLFYNMRKPYKPTDSTSIQNSKTKVSPIDKDLIDLLPGYNWGQNNLSSKEEFELKIIADLFLFVGTRLSISLHLNYLNNQEKILSARMKLMECLKIEDSSGIQHIVNQEDRDTMYQNNARLNYIISYWPDFDENTNQYTVKIKYSDNSTGDNHINRHNADNVQNDILTIDINELPQGLENLTYEQIIQDENYKKYFQPYDYVDTNHDIFKSDKKPFYWTDEEWKNRAPGTGNKNRKEHINPPGGLNYHRNDDNNPIESNKEFILTRIRTIYKKQEISIILNNLLNYHRDILVQTNYLDIGSIDVSLIVPEIAKQLNKLALLPLLFDEPQVESILPQNFNTDGIINNNCSVNDFKTKIESSNEIYQSEYMHKAIDENKDDYCFPGTDYYINNYINTLYNLDNITLEKYPGQLANESLTNWPEPEIINQEDIWRAESMGGKIKGYASYDTSRFRPNFDNNIYNLNNVSYNDIMNQTISGVHNELHEEKNPWFNKEIDNNNKYIGKLPNYYPPRYGITSMTYMEEEIKKNIIDYYRFYDFDLVDVIGDDEYDTNVPTCESPNPDDSRCQFDGADQNALNDGSWKNTNVGVRPQDQNAVTWENRCINKTDDQGSLLGCKFNYIPPSPIRRDNIGARAEFAWNGISSFDSGIGNMMSDRTNVGCKGRVGTQHNPNSDNNECTSKTSILNEPNSFINMLFANLQKLINKLNEDVNSLPGIEENNYFDSDWISNESLKNRLLHYVSNGNIYRSITPQFFLDKLPQCNEFTTDNRSNIPDIDYLVELARNSNILLGSTNYPLITETPLPKFRAICPEGSKAGDLITVQYLQQDIQVIVPQGVNSGQEFYPIDTTQRPSSDTFYQNIQSDKISDIYQSENTFLKNILKIGRLTKRQNSVDNISESKTRSNNYCSRLPMDECGNDICKIDLNTKECVRDDKNIYEPLEQDTDDGFNIINYMGLELQFGIDSSDNIISKGISPIFLDNNNDKWSTYVNNVGTLLQKNISSNNGETEEGGQCTEDSDCNTNTICVQNIFNPNTSSCRVPSIHPSSITCTRSDSNVDMEPIFSTEGDIYEDKLNNITNDIESKIGIIMDKETGFGCRNIIFSDISNLHSDRAENEQTEDEGTLETKYGGNWALRSIFQNPNNIPEYGTKITNDFCLESAECFYGYYCSENDNMCHPCYECTDSDNCNDVKCDGGWDVRPGGEGVIDCMKMKYNNSYNNINPSINETFGVMPYIGAISGISTGETSLSSYMGLAVNDYERHNNMDETSYQRRLHELLYEHDCKHLPHHIKDDILMSYSENVIDESYINEYRELCDYYMNLHITQYVDFNGPIYNRCTTTSDCAGDTVCYNNYCIKNPCNQDTLGFIPPLYNEDCTNYNSNQCNSHEHCSWSVNEQTQVSSCINNFCGIYDNNQVLCNEHPSCTFTDGKCSSTGENQNLNLYDRISNIDTVCNTDNQYIEQETNLNNICDTSYLNHIQNDISKQDAYYVEYPEQKSQRAIGKVSCKNNYHTENTEPPIISCNNNEWIIENQCQENQCAINNNDINIIKYDIIMTETENIDLASELANNISCNDRYSGNPIITCKNTCSQFNSQECQNDDECKLNSDGTCVNYFKLDGCY